MGGKTYIIFQAFFIISFTSNIVSYFFHQLLSFLSGAVVRFFVFRRLRFHVLFLQIFFVFLSNFFLKIVFVLAFSVIVQLFSSFFYGSFCFILLQVNVCFFDTSWHGKESHQRFFFKERGFVKSVNNVERLRECFQLRPLSIL